MTDNEVTRPALHEDEAGCYKTEAEYFGLEALEANDLTSLYDTY